MFKWELKEINLPLKVEWAISRFATREKNNFVVTVSDENFVGEGEVAWNSRFGESAKKIREAFDRFNQNIPKNIQGIEELLGIFDDMNIPASLKFGLEAAYTSLLSRLSQKSVQELLGVNTVRSIGTSFSIPLMSLRKVKDFIENNNLKRFDSLKVKLSGSNYDIKVLKLITSIYSKRLYLDANEAFKNTKDFLKFVEKVEKYPIEFIEQPLPAECHDGYLELKKQSPIPIFADESLVESTVTDYFLERFDGVNVKLMKSGSYFKAIRQMKEAREQGLKIQLGCMIESSLGISGALRLASKADYIDLDGFLFLENDPYKLLLEENGKLFFSEMH